MVTRWNEITPKTEGYYLLRTNGKGICTMRIYRAVETDTTLKAQPVLPFNVFTTPLFDLFELSGDWAFIGGLEGKTT